MAPDQRAERRDRHDRVAHHGEPGERHVDIHDAHGYALLEIFWGREAHIKADGKQDRGHRHQPRNDLVRQPDEARRIGEIGPTGEA